MKKTDVNDKINDDLIIHEDEPCQRQNKRYHGMRRTRFYQIWMSMKNRVTEGYTNHRYYYDRGITVCGSWQDFLGFYYDMYDSYLKHAIIYGEKDTSIDRVDNSKGYSPDNCRWATRTAQQNNRSNNKIVTIEGRVHTLAEWAEISGINYHTLYSRLNSCNCKKADLLIEPKGGRNIDKPNKRIQ